MQNQNSTSYCETAYEDGILSIRIVGEIDHHSAKDLREKIDKEMFFYKAKRVELDLSRVAFMDSAGLGLILGRYAKAIDLGGKLKILNPSASAEKLLTLAGTDRFIQIVKFERNVK